MKILFIGSVKFSSEILKIIISMNSNVIGVCTKKISPFNSDFYDLSSIAKDNNIPFNYVKNINSDKNINWIKNLDPDIIFCFGWSSLIKKELLNLLVLMKI